MAPELAHLHDASLRAIHHDWAARSVTLEFAAAPAIAEPFEITFAGVARLVVPSQHPWGSSVSVPSAVQARPGHYELVMQSGDTIIIEVD